MLNYFSPPINMDDVISIRSITKRFGDLKAVDSLSFSVKRNTIFGLVGPDGAGKTTLIKMLCGLIKPDEGSAEILGYDLKTGIDKIKNDIGYLSQKFSLYTDLTVDENIEFIADIHGVKKFQDRRNELLDFTRLKDFRKFYAANLSGGMKQKLSLACTLIYQPKIILLDEPTTGVDPVSRREFWIILSNLLKKDITILISTPYMDEAERFNEIALIDKGKLLDVDTPEKLIAKMTGTVVEITTDSIRDAYHVLTKNTGFEIQMFGDRVNIVADTPDALNEIENILKKNSVRTTSIRTISPTLENAFIHLIRKAG